MTMIQYVLSAHLFESEADALVNPVNCAGTMGRGIALEFKRRFPEILEPYKRACAAGDLVPGRLLLMRSSASPELPGEKRPAVILFPTKRHWRGQSRIEWIEQGLAFLQAHYRAWDLRSIAMPQVGCGLGGLDWEQVRPLVESLLGHEDLTVEVYLRAAADERASLSAQKRKVRTRGVGPTSAPPRKRAKGRARE